MYYVYKMGVYGHGVFWVGQDGALAIKKARQAAANDIDGYHEWAVYRHKNMNLGKSENLMGPGEDYQEQIFITSKDNQR